MMEVPAAITTSGTFGSKCSRRDAEAGNETDLVVDDQFLGEALGVVGKGSIIPEDDFDLLAGNGVAVLLHIQLDRIVDLLAGRRLAARHRQDQADLDAFLRARGHHRERAQHRSAKYHP
jgi:hypothetical protein